MWKTQKTCERLEEDLRALRRRVDDLESAHKRLDLEWEELYDKVRRQMARMSKRHAVDAKEAAVDPPPEPDDKYAHVDPISRSILMRRAMRGVPK